MDYTKNTAFFPQSRRNKLTPPSSPETRHRVQAIDGSIRFWTPLSDKAFLGADTLRLHRFLSRRILPLRYALTALNLCFGRLTAAA